MVKVNMHVYLQALEVNKQLNCVTEPILAAEDYAAACDRQKVEKGVLHGIPVSLKESFHLQVGQPVCFLTTNTQEPLYNRVKCPGG